jgi:L-lactate utilization protein LutC
VGIAGFTIDVCKENQRAIAQTTKPTAGQAVKAMSKESLRTFNGERALWLQSKRYQTAHLNQIKNEKGVPVWYVIRDREEENQHQSDNGEIGRKIYDAAPKGMINEADAFFVLQILWQWMAGGRAETHVDKTNDVQDA